MTPVTLVVIGLPSGSVAPVSVIKCSLWFGGHRFGPPVTVLQIGLWFSVVTTVEWLFPGTGSLWFPATTAVFVSVEPVLPAVTVTSKLRDAPEARLPTVQVTTPASCVQPALAETNVELDGSVSVTVTPVAAAGPLLVAVRWYVNVSPSVTRLGPVFTTARSAPLTVIETVWTKAGPAERPFCLKSTEQCSVVPPGFDGSTVSVSVNGTSLPLVTVLLAAS